MFECECNNIKLTAPDGSIVLMPGNRVRLGRFSMDVWIVNYGWYSWGGNRKVCGWYLTNCKNHKAKPLQDTDLCDIYLIEI